MDYNAEKNKKLTLDEQVPMQYSFASKKGADALYDQSNIGYQSLTDFMKARE